MLWFMETIRQYSKRYIFRHLQRQIHLTKINNAIGLLKG